MQPETRYARSGDVSIAYQVVGEGPFDVVVVPGLVSHVELAWETPPWSTIFRRLASFSRLIVFDKRGTGMSDRVSGAPTLETRMDDVRAVMDAAGSPRAALVGISEGTAMSLLFAATYPERTVALVAIGGFARSMWAPDYPPGFSEEQWREVCVAIAGIFGSRDEARAAVRFLARYTDEELELSAAYHRRSASPGALDALVAMDHDIDVRHVLPSVRAPAMLVHGTHDMMASIDGARYMAERIPGARLLELPGELHVPIGPALDQTMDEIEQFLKRASEAGGDDSEPERVLATILFTDIVGSTERASALGDRAWHELLERHHELVRSQLVRFRGTEVNTAGDGFFASFDGPARAIRCASAIVDSVRELDLEVRTGLHTGECELVNGKVSGIAVHTGARVAAEAAASEVLVSSTVKDLVAGSGLAFDDRGTHPLKGIPGDWHLFAVDRATA